MHFAILLVDIGEFCPMDVVAVVVVVALAVAVVAQGMRAFVPRRSRPLFLGQHVGEESCNQRGQEEGSPGAMGKGARCEPWKAVVAVPALVVDGSARRIDGP